MAIPFPKDLSPIAFSIPPFHILDKLIGPLEIKWYALGYITGILIAWFILSNLVKTPYLWKENRPSFTTENIDDLIFYATLGILFGGRLGYVFIYQPEMLHNPLSILKVWEGGMSFHGGLIGVILATIYVSAKERIPLLNISDAVAYAAPLGIGIVRIANFINQELWGRPTDVPWAVIFDTDPLRLPRHPSQLYESFFEGFLIFIVLSICIKFFKTLKHKGLTTGIFLVMYALARILLENFRQPDAFLPHYPFGLTMGMMLSVPVLILGISFIVSGINEKSRY